MKVEQLLEIWESLAETERMVLLTYAKRLQKGQRLFGPMYVDKKDWAYEAIEEALDASIYLTALLSDRVTKAYNNGFGDDLPPNGT